MMRHLIYPSSEETAQAHQIRCYILRYKIKLYIKLGSIFVTFILI
jgi:hypothetical protein